MNFINNSKHILFHSSLKESKRVVIKNIMSFVTKSTAYLIIHIFPWFITSRIAKLNFGKAVNNIIKRKRQILLSLTMAYLTYQLFYERAKMLCLYYLSKRSHFTFSYPHSRFWKILVVLYHNDIIFYHNFYFITNSHIATLW